MTPEAILADLIQSGIEPSVTRPLQRTARRRTAFPRC